MTKLHVFARLILFALFALQKSAHAQAGACGALVETVVIPTTGVIKQSKHALEAGRRFVLRASGIFFIGGTAGLADAEYEFNCDASKILDYAVGFDIGIAVDTFASVRKKWPRWGAYNAATHNYVTDYVGTGKPVGFRYNDDFYPDNRGNLTVDIFEGDAREACVELPQSSDFVQLHEASRLVARELLKCKSALEFAGPAPRASGPKTAGPVRNADAGPVVPGGANDVSLGSAPTDVPLLLPPIAPQSEDDAGKLLKR